MLQKAEFWLALMAGLVLFYAYALLLLLQGQHQHLVLTISMVLLAAHALEIPLALRALRGRGISFAKMLLPTLLFGLLWWVPTSRGVFGEASRS